MNIAELLLPPDVLDHFEVVSIEETKSLKQVDIYLDELYQPPSSEYTYLSKGFTEERIMQDFPVRGKAVYLHVRRRKWLEKETGKIVTSIIELTHDGTQLTHEFAVFLKRTGSNPHQYR